MSDALRQMLQRPDAEIEVLRGALLIAELEFPDLDHELYLGCVTELVEGARRRQGELSPGSRAALDSLCAHLFQEVGFHGNDVDYYDPRNSYLNEVLDRRLGIPITLALIASEVGRRIGLDTFGVGFPGRFLLGCRIQGDTEAVIVDCHEGRVIDHEGCRRILAEIYGGAMTFHPALLQPATSRQVLARLVANLLTIYIQRRDVTRALCMAHVAVLAEPDEAHAYRNRGLLHYEAGEYREAIADLEHCLRLLPEGGIAPVIEHHLTQARARLASWN